MNTREDIEERLLAVGQSAHALLQFPPGIDFVKELARYGAERIDADGFLNDERKIRLAEANFDHLLMRLAVKREYVPSGLISEILQELRICPLFPFC